MFKSIFSRLVSVFIILLIVSYIVTGLTLNTFLSNFVSEDKSNLLDNSASELTSLLKTIVENQGNDSITKPLKSMLELLMESYSNNSSSIIWIIDSNGYLLDYASFSNQMNGKILSRFKQENGMLRLPDKRQYSKIMSGTTVTNKEIGNFYNFFKKDTGTTWLVIQKPFIYNSKVIGAVYISTPLSEINRLKMQVLRFFLLSVSVASLVSIILVYLFSKRITNPLKQMNKAARLIASGKFQEKLDIKSQDEIGELAESFNNMAVALENMENMRRGFIANVSHELRTPMTSITGFVEGILDGTITPERQNYYLTIVKDETKRLSRLVTDLLDLAKMEAEEIPLTMRCFNINELTRRCIIKFENLIVQKEINIDAQFECEDMYAEGNVDGIERVLFNLIHNAIKFTPEGGSIQIKTSMDKKVVYVTIEDSGMGIDKEELPFIWDRFYKTDKSRSKDKSGTGLGLAIVKNIINQHKQQIFVKSEVGKGTRFTFTLNRCEEPEKPEDQI